MQSSILCGDRAVSQLRSADRWLTMYCELLIANLYLNNKHTKSQYAKRLNISGDRKFQEDDTQEVARAARGHIAHRLSGWKVETVRQSERDARCVFVMSASHCCTCGRCLPEDYMGEACLHAQHGLRWVCSRS